MRKKRGAGNLEGDPLADIPAAEPSALLQWKLDRDTADEGRPASAVRRARILAVLRAPRAAKDAARVAWRAAEAAALAATDPRVMRYLTRRHKEEARAAAFEAAAVAVTANLSAQVSVREMAIKTSMILTAMDASLPFAVGGSDMRKLLTDFDRAASVADRMHWREKKNADRRRPWERRMELEKDLAVLNQEVVETEEMRIAAMLLRREQALAYMCPFLRNRRVVASVTLSKWMRRILAKMEAVRRMRVFFTKVYDEEYECDYYYDRFTDTSVWSCPFLLRNDDRCLRLLSDRQSKAIDTMQTWAKEIMRAGRMRQVMLNYKAREEVRRATAKRHWQILRSRTIGLQGLTMNRLREELRTYFRLGGEEAIQKALRILRRRPRLATERNLFSGGGALHGLCAWGFGFDRTDLRWVVAQDPEAVSFRETESGRGLLPLHLLCRSQGLTPPPSPNHVNLARKRRERKRLLLLQGHAEDVIDGGDEIYGDGKATTRANKHSTYGSAVDPTGGAKRYEGGGYLLHDRSAYTLFYELVVAFPRALTAIDL